MLSLVYFFYVMGHILHVCLSFSETSSLLNQLNLGIDCYFKYSWYLKICNKLYIYLLLFLADCLKRGMVIR